MREHGTRNSRIGGMRPRRYVGHIGGRATSVTIDVVRAKLGIVLLSERRRHHRECDKRVSLP